jgi:hypothetical protein
MPRAPAARQRRRIEWRARTGRYENEHSVLGSFLCVFSQTDGFASDCLWCQPTITERRHERIAWPALKLVRLGHAHGDGHSLHALLWNSFVNQMTTQAPAAMGTTCEPVTRDHVVISKFHCDRCHYCKRSQISAQRRVCADIGDKGGASRIQTLTWG